MNKDEMEYVLEEIRLCAECGERYDDVWEAYCGYYFITQENFNEAFNKGLGTK